jgi:hypothetical protein
VPWVVGNVDHGHVEVILRDVLVPATVVESDGFTAEVGGTVSMALELYCEYWADATDHDRPGLVAVHSGTDRHTGSCSVHELVGIVVPTETVGVTGWMLDVAGLLLYVQQAPDHDDPGGRNSMVHRDPLSRTGLPAPGSTVRVRGELSIAEYYVTSMFEPEQPLLDGATRTWSVRRMARLERDRRYRDVRATGRMGDNGLGYLLDIAEVAE